MERLRLALEDAGCRPRGSGQRFRATCPVHESHGSATLAVSQGRNGALLKCHAQCETGDVLAALGLTWDDTFDQPRERSPDWRPRRRPADDARAELIRVVERAVRIAILRDQLAEHRERCPMPEIPWQERVALAEWASQRDADQHFWRVTARRAALARDRRYVRTAYGAWDKWLRTRNPDDKPGGEQLAVLLVRAEDLQRERGRLDGAA